MAEPYFHLTARSGLFPQQKLRDHSAPLFLFFSGTAVRFAISPAVLAPGTSLSLSSRWRLDELRPERAEWYVATFYQLINNQSQLVINQ